MKNMYVKQSKLLKLPMALLTGIGCMAASNATAAPDISLGVERGQAGSSVNVPVLFENDATVAAFQFDVLYDVNHAAPSAVQNGVSLTATGHTASAAVISPGIYRVVIAPPSDNAVINSGTVAEISFVLNAAASSSQMLSFANVVMRDAKIDSVAVGQLTSGLIAVTGDTSSDSDGDGVPDAWEIGYDYDPFNPQDANQDDDGDGLTTLAEYGAGTNPTLVDSDGDAMADGWEVEYGLNPTDAADASLDLDGDGVSNVDEFLAGTDPTVASVQADVCSSGCAYASIQAAVNAAANNDTIIVGPGTYNESIVTSGNLVTLVSATGATDTIIDVTGLGQTAVTLNVYSTIDGFTIMGGEAANGAGIYVSANGGIIRNSIIKNLASKENSA